jgi:curved DNA-binding protein CbpA
VKGKVYWAMNTCSCGSLIDAGYKQCPRCEAVQVLGVQTDATESQIRSAHRLLAKAWSPENFQDDQKLKDAAEEKLKDITTAFYFLTSTSSERYHEERPCYVACCKAPDGQSTDVKPAENNQAPSLSPNAFSLLPEEEGIKSLARILPKPKTLLKIAALIVVLFIGISIWAGLRSLEPGAAQAANVKPSNLRGGANAPEESLLEMIKKDLQSLDPRESSQEQQTDPSADQPAPRNSTRVQTGKIRAATSSVQPAANATKSYITVGSTKDDVLAQQGTPTAASEDKLVYGKSELYLKDGFVVGWRIDSGASVIRVKLWPQYTINPSPEYFTIGSSRDIVLAVQGTPTTLTEDKFQYGGSEVSFRNNKVESWKSDPASIPLRAR